MYPLNGEFIAGMGSHFSGGDFLDGDHCKLKSNKNKIDIMMRRLNETKYQLMF